MSAEDNLEAIWEDTSGPARPSVSLNQGLMNDDTSINNHARASAISYDNHDIIDWAIEHERDHAEYSHATATAKVISIAQHWLVVIFSGILVGLIAAFMDIAAQWLGDIKVGHCKSSFYLSREFCCWALNQRDDLCHDWSSWSRSLLGYAPQHRGVAGYIIAFFIYSFLSVCFAGAASVLVVRLKSVYAQSSGIAEIKTVLGGLVIKDLFSARTLIIKAVAMCLAVSSGLWVGKEGPLVHIACCCAGVLITIIGQNSFSEARKRELLSAASAAGISVAFGAPIGGVLFTLEQMTYFSNEHVMWESFVAAMVAAVTLQWVNPFRTGKLVLFGVVYDRNWHHFELVPFAIIGVLGGLFGAGIERLTGMFASLRASKPWLKHHPIFEVLITAAVITILSYPNFYTRLESTVLLSHLFEECPADVDGRGVLQVLCDPSKWFQNILLLILSSLVGFIATAYCFGLAVPAGILMPSMLVGALGGRAIGATMQAWKARFPALALFDSCPPEGICVTPGVYALVGAASALTGTTRLTVSSVVIMFELTGALNYVFPIMVGVIISKWVADSSGRRGIYETVIQRKNYPYLEKGEPLPIPEICASEIFTPISDITYLTSFQTVGELKALLSTTKFRGYPVVSGAVTNDYRMIGYLLEKRLKVALLNKGNEVTDESPCVFSDEQSAKFTGQPVLDLRGEIDYTPPVLSSDASLLLVISMFQSMGYQKIIFTQKGAIRGIMTAKDAWRVMRDLESGDFAPGWSNNRANDGEESSASLLRRDD